MWEFESMFRKLLCFLDWQFRNEDLGQIKKQKKNLYIMTDAQLLVEYISNARAISTP